VAIFHWLPMAGRALSCGIMAALYWLLGFAVGGVPGGVSRSHSGRCARDRRVMRFLKPTVFCEVGEDGADCGGFFDAGDDP